MSKTIIAIIIIVIIGVFGYWFFQSAPEPQEINEEEAKACEIDSDCLVFGKDGDCSCGCFNKKHDWEAEGACFCAAPVSCKCVEGKCKDVFEESREVAIKNLFAEKYDKEVFRAHKWIRDKSLLSRILKR